MKHIIIGTAGHVDHGKTALVKALTGIDTDRLEEEKRRGLTIEPGFAYLDFPDGTRAGLIDVPGHERFIRNMLAGAGGVDLAILVVASDEGVMPQTREHLAILVNLGIKNGVVAVTKADKADPDWLELVIDEIKQFVSGTFLDGKPILTVSALTGEGISELKQTLRGMIDNVSEKDADVPFRLPVDRVFPVDGFGTVVTGTLIEGSVKIGDMAEILPMGEKAPVRNIQVHGDNVSAAYAGQRTAISLGGVKRGIVKRGDVVAAVGSLNVVTEADVKLNVIADTNRMIKNGDALHIYHGARTLLAKAVLIDKGKLQHGDSCFARIKFSQPLPCKRGDRFIVRFFSPLETIGGGTIIRTKAGKRVGKSKQEIDALQIYEHGSVEEITELAARQHSEVFTHLDICKYTDADLKSCRAAVETLLSSRKIIQVLPERYISAEALDILGGRSSQLLKEFHAKNPLRAGMSAAELRQKLIPDAEMSDAGAVLSALSDRRVIVLSGSFAALPDFSPTLTEIQARIKQAVLETLTAAGYDTPSPDELSSLFSRNEQRDFKQVLENLRVDGDIVMLSQQICWAKGVYEMAVEILHGHFNSNDTVTLAECRDLLATSRKYALAFLEHLDGKKVTKLVGDKRILLTG